MALCAFYGRVCRDLCSGSCEVDGEVTFMVGFVGTVVGTVVNYQWYVGTTLKGLYSKSFLTVPTDHW